MSIRLIITNGKDTDWREIDLTETIVFDLTEYEKSKDLYDIEIENEGEPIRPEVQKEGNVRYVYDNPDAPTLPPKRKQPWEMF